MIRLLLLLPALLAGCSVTVGPKVPPPKIDPSAAWEAVLHQVVDDDGYVDYDKLAAHRKPLDAYVAWLSTGRMPIAGEARLAYQLNAYNALVLWLVLDVGRPASVLDVPPTAFWPGGPGAGFYHQRMFRFGADRLSLARIENERIRNPAQDIRVYAAMNGGCRSDPPLRGALYRGDRIDFQLQDQMSRWIMDEDRGVRIEHGVAVFNPIFHHYAHDFATWTAGDDLCTIAAGFAWGDLQTRLESLADKGCPHRFFKWDGRLNQPPHPAASTP